MGCDGEIDDMLRIRLREFESNKQIFTSVAWIRAFNINEPIYVELCHEFYSTYKFDEVCADDELQTKKIIKFRLGGHAHNLTLLEFARRLGLYHAGELEEYRFNVYFEGGLRSDEHFNAQEYWLSPNFEGDSQDDHLWFVSEDDWYDKIQKNDLWLLSMFDARHQNRYANVAWLIARWIKRKGAGTQKESQICYGQFISKIYRKSRVLTDDVTCMIGWEDGIRHGGDKAKGVIAVISLGPLTKGVFEHMAGFTVFQYRDLQTHRSNALSNSMINNMQTVKKISTHLHHYSIHAVISSSKQQYDDSSVEMTQVSCDCMFGHEGFIHDHTVRLGELSPALFEMYDRDIGELFTRLVLCLESWAGQTDIQRAALWHAISDTQMENWELRLQIAEERRAWLDLAEIVDSIRRGHEPREDV
ncbi:hypothetical protein Tco_0377805 [Tanacetum coccineum]